MFKNIREFLKNNVRLEIFMSIVLLAAVTLIACNVNEVIENKEKTPETIVNLNGKAVVIDVGHGGKDPGKIGVAGTKEKNVNLAIAKALQEELKKNGYRVVMTRENDSVLSEGEHFSKVKDLNARCEIINNTYSQNPDCIMISIHQNSFTQSTVCGAQSFYYQRSEKSRQLAEIIQSNLNKNINIEKPKKSKPNDSYYMLINSKCPGVIVECGFLSNSEEEAKLQNEEYQMIIAKIIGTSINEYFGIE